jgi:hypothetical protein
MESLAFTPKKMLLLTKGISESKADKILEAGALLDPLYMPLVLTLLPTYSWSVGSVGLHHCHGIPFSTCRLGLHYDWIKES